YIWGMGSREWGVGRNFLYPLPIPYFPSSTSRPRTRLRARARRGRGRRRKSPQSVQGVARLARFQVGRRNVRPHVRQFRVQFRSLFHMDHRVVVFLLIEIDPAQIIERLGVGWIGGQQDVDAVPGLRGTASQMERERGADLRIAGT